MNKIFLVIFMSAPLLAMNSPEGPRHWQRISLEELKLEVAAVPDNREAKREFLQEQIARRDALWIDMEKLGMADQIMQRNKDDYTAADLDMIETRIAALKSTKKSQTKA